MDQIAQLKTIILELRAAGQNIHLPTVAAQMGVSEYKVKELLKTLVSLGFLTLNYNKYRINDNQVSTQESSTPEAPKPIPQTRQPEAIRKPEPLPRQPEPVSPESVLISPITILIIKYAMAGIGVIAAGMSVYYTTLWLLEFLPVIPALLLSIAVVGFSVLAFEVMLIFWQPTAKNAKQKLIRPQAWISAVFGLLWLVVMLFSIMSTVAGLYNKRAGRSVADARIEAKNIQEKLELEGYNIIEQDLKQVLSEKRTEYAVIAKQWREAGTNEQPRYYRQMKAVEHELKAVQRDLDKARQARLSYIRSKGVNVEPEKLTFYRWLGEKVFRASPDLIEFLLSLFPAIFVDIITPLALAVTLFLNGGKK